MGLPCLTNTHFMMMFIVYLLLVQLFHLEDGCFIKFQIKCNSIRGGLFSTPLWNGLVSILLIAVAVCFVIDALEIKSKTICAGISAFMVAFPVIAGMLGFMFTCPYYSLAILMTIAGAAFAVQKKKWYGFIIAVLLIGAAIGIYQAYIPLFLSLFTISYIKECFNVEDDKSVSGKLVLYAIYYVAVSIMALIFYLCANQYMLWKYNEKMSSYKGLDRMGKMTFYEFVERAKYAYVRFFIPDPNIFPRYIERIYMIIVIGAVGLSFFSLFVCLRKIGKQEFFL